jgi:CheY-like chemotaxis protein
VIVNLLNNAAKYTEPGGKISLAVETEGGQAVLRVKDTGIGIPPDVLPRVCDMFMQVDPKLPRSQGGLGIGLTLVRRLTEMHGGALEAFSEGPGKGSEFVVRLPLPTDQPRADRAVDAAEAVNPHRSFARRILIVDDNRDSADSFARLLRIMGHEVLTAHDGEQAVEMAVEFRPDVVFLDIGLPGMDGYALAATLHAQPALSGAVLIALTGYGTDADRQRSQQAGFFAHLVKPVQFAGVQEMLDLLPVPKRAEC